MGEAMRDCHFEEISHLDRDAQDRPHPPGISLVPGDISGNRSAQDSGESSVLLRSFFPSHFREALGTVPLKDVFLPASLFGIQKNNPAPSYPPSSAHAPFQRGIQLHEEKTRM